MQHSALIFFSENEADAPARDAADCRECVVRPPVAKGAHPDRAWVAI